MPKALIVSPYLDHLGGGERYMLSAASVLEKLGHQVFFAWDNLAEITKLCNMLGINLLRPALDSRVKNLYFARNPLKMYLATREFDVVVYLSDGSLPLLGGKKNLVHLQVPFHGVGGTNLKNQLKKLLLSKVIVNSRFTKKIVDQEYNINSVVVYPPVLIEKCEGINKKEKLILSVGRFEPSLNAKRHDVMIEAFKKLRPKGWKLVLAGASSSEEWVGKLKRQANDARIEFAVNATYNELASLYCRASIYWHAAGFGIDEGKNPELVEHFGITTAEAIGNGCIPLVVPSGGQREIVTDERLHWTSTNELIAKTKQVITGEINASILASMPVDRYNEQEFASSLKAII